MAHYDSKSTATPQRVMVEVGVRLAKIRLSRNITQRALAKDAGIALRTLRRLELGEATAFDSFLRVVMTLGFTDEFLKIFPLHDTRPIERMDARRKERKRARPARVKDTDKAWTWGES